MKKTHLLIISSIALLFSCVDPIRECAICYSIKKNINTNSIEEKISEGSKCGTELDSLESIEPIEIDGYEYSYMCE